MSQPRLPGTLPAPAVARRNHKAAVAAEREAQRTYDGLREAAAEARRVLKKATAARITTEGMWAIENEATIGSANGNRTSNRRFHPLAPGSNTLMLQRAPRSSWYLFASCLTVTFARCLQRAGGSGRRLRRSQHLVLKQGARQKQAS